MIPFLIAALAVLAVILIVAVLLIGRRHGKAEPDGETTLDINEDHAFSVKREIVLADIRNVLR